MAGRVLSTPATRALTAEETDEVFLVLLKTSHGDLVDAIRVVNRVEAIEHDRESYVGLPFE